MFRFPRIRNNLYQYRGFNVVISFDESKNTTMLAKTKNASGASVQFYFHGCDFERIKGILIRKVNTYLEDHASEAPDENHEAGT